MISTNSEWMVKWTRWTMNKNVPGGIPEIAEREVERPWNLMQVNLHTVAKYSEY